LQISILVYYVWVVVCESVRQDKPDIVSNEKTQTYIRSSASFRFMKRHPDILVRTTNSAAIAATSGETVS